MEKPIHKSKTVWAAAFIVGVSVAELMNSTLPIDNLLMIGAAFGLYGIRDAIGSNSVRRMSVSTSQSSSKNVKQIVINLN